MLYQGQSLKLEKIKNNFLELKFEAQSDVVNKFDIVTMRELSEVVDLLKKEVGVRGLLVSSSKEGFIVGADIMQFLPMFQKPEEELLKWVRELNLSFTGIDNLPYPTVSALHGFALGGGMELALCTHYRVAATNAKVGLPEVKLGIFPGFGGTVRLPRVIGADNAIEWIASGTQYSAEEAFKFGAIDAVVEMSDLHAAALNLLEQAADGKLNWKQRQEQKMSPLKLNRVESGMVFEGAKAFVMAQAGPNYPAPVAAVEVMQKGAGLGRDQALDIEHQGFVKVAKTPQATSLIGIFLGDQYLKKVARKVTKKAAPIKQAAVMGAGIMGGGVAYQSASKDVPIVMKDINTKALELGMNEAGKLLTKLVERGKMKADHMAVVLSRIRATLGYEDIKEANIVVEAVIENEDIKRKVFAELETVLPAQTVIASNTSSISINSLAMGLKHPERFCGMHFFNPVYKMPLVEVIRGQKTSDEAIATTVAYAIAMGKSPIIVNDCAGFLVNRTLFPYFTGFFKLVGEGADIYKIDKVMEKFGWPMGPAFLLDMVGIDTAHHAKDVMGKAFPDRMTIPERTALDVMYEQKRYGQKNGIGFYQHLVDKKGKLKKEKDPAAQTLIDTMTGGKKKEFSDQEIIERMMLPMLVESARCLEERIVDSHIEVDMGMVYGIGFPPFRGGMFRWADTVGMEQLCQQLEKYSHLGALYQPTAQMVHMARSGKKYYQLS